jgi:hypothetical protein
MLAEAIRSLGLMTIGTMFGRSLQMHASNPASQRERPRLRSALNYLLLIVVFGVVVPRLKGLAFFDPVLMSAYACIGMVFSGPATAQVFRTKPGSLGEALRWILQSVLFGELIAAAMLAAGILTVYLTHLRSLFFLPDLVQIAISGAFGLTGSLTLASMAGWLTLRFSAGVARGTLRIVFLVLLVLFFLRGQWLPAAAASGIPVALVAAAVFVELLRRELKRHEIRTDG